MDDHTQEALKKAAEYVSETQPQLEAYEQKQASFATQADRTSAVLVNRGVLLDSKREEFVTKCAEDPSFALQFMEKMAAAIGTTDLGEPAEVKAAEDGAGDPFEQEFFPERFHKPTGTIN